MTSSLTFGSPTLHRPSRRTRLPVVAGLVVVALTVAIGVVVWHRITRPDYIGTDGWPRVGQGAYRLGDDRPAISPKQQPVPIASVAKVMTAYVATRAWPLAAGADGPVHKVTDADILDTERRRHNDESVVGLTSGQSLSERQALMAILLPSANNVAMLLARWISGSIATFVALMNRTARSLHMTDTTYTDPSGLDATTVSTAADQLVLAEVVAKLPVLYEVMQTRSYELPYAGTIRNTDTLLGKGGFVGMKTGSDDAAGGCFMFHALRARSDGTSVHLIGVVLGQPGSPRMPLVRAGQVAAQQLADRIVPGVKHP
jgi:serine-type D-Ala-D-Ala carboxypeptidase (penicillin-binding protein 5/6)